MASSDDKIIRLGIVTGCIVVVVAIVSISFTEIMRLEGLQKALETEKVSEKLQEIEERIQKLENNRITIAGD